MSGRRAFGSAPRPSAGRNGLAKFRGELTLRRRQRGEGAASTCNWDGGERAKSRARSGGMTQMAAKSAHAARAVSRIGQAVLVWRYIAPSPCHTDSPAPAPWPARAAARRSGQTTQIPGMESGDSIPGGGCRIWATAVHRHSSEATDRRATCRRAPCNPASRATADPWRGRRRLSCRASG